MATKAVVGRAKRGILDNLIFVLRNIWNWDKGVFTTIGFHSIFMAAAPFIWVFAPKFLIDELLGPKRMEILAGVLIAALVASGTANYFTAYLIGAYRMKMSNIRFQFIHMMNEKAMAMDFKHTENPVILNSIQQAWRTVHNPYNGIGGILQKLFNIFGSLIGFLGYVTIIFILNPFILAYLAVNVLINYYLTLRAKEYERSRKDELSQYERKSRYLGSTMSDFQYGKDIRIYGLKPMLVEKKKHLDEKRLEVAEAVQSKLFKASLVDSLMLLLREGIVYTYLVYNVIRGGMSIGNFTMYAAAISGFATWMNTFLMDIAFIKISCQYTNDFRDFLDIEDDDIKKGKRAIPENKPYELELKGVSFKYPNSEAYIFKKLSLKIKAGEKLAIVGINGAGKTTLVKLLTRLYQPTEGEILLNGINITEFDEEQYFKLFSVVFQEIKMFAFTVAENITFSDRVHEMSRLLSAIEKAGIKEKISTLDKGLDTSVLKVLDQYGTEFSGGENQKLALARALYKNGEIIILDEPTAALDPLAEYNMYNSFNEMIGGRTAIYISHRLSSTRFCDSVAFFEKGEIVEYGSHEELLKLQGKYADMFNLQAQYYRDQQLAKEA